MMLDQYGILKINEDIIVEGGFEIWKHTVIPARPKHTPCIKEPVKKERLVASQKPRILRFQVFWIPI